MPPIPLTTLDDERLAPYRNLTDRQLESWGNRFVVEGERLTRRLLATDIPVESILAEAERAEHVLAWAPPGVPLYTLPAAEMRRVVGYQIHSGVLSCAVRKPWPPLEALLTTPASRPDAAAPPAASASPASPPSTLLICPQLKNTENLGSTIRIAAAFGVTGLLLGPTCCDPFCRRTVRVSMGGAFTLPIRKSPDLHADLRRLRDAHGYELFATVLDERAEPLHTVRRAPGQRIALLMGHEVTGLPDDITALCTRRVTIPMHLGADSLNVSVAAAVFLYHFTAPTA